MLKRRPVAEHTPVETLAPEAVPSLQLKDTTPAFATSGE